MKGNIYIQCRSLSFATWALARWERVMGGGGVLVRRPFRNEGSSTRTASRWRHPGSKKLPRPSLPGAQPATQPWPSYPMAMTLGPPMELGEILNLRCSSPSCWATGSGHPRAEELLREGSPICLRPGTEARSITSVKVLRDEYPGIIENIFSKARGKLLYLALFIIKKEG